MSVAENSTPKENADTRNKADEKGDKHESEYFWETMNFSCDKHCALCFLLGFGLINCSDDDDNEHAHSANGEITRKLLCVECLQWAVDHSVDYSRTTHESQFVKRIINGGQACVRSKCQECKRSKFVVFSVACCEANHRVLARC